MTDSATTAPAAEAVARKPVDWFTPTLMLACVGLSVLVLVLARENRHLKETLAAVGPMTPPRARADELKPGDSLGPVTLLTAKGDERPLAFDQPGRRTVLLFFSQGCHLCDEVKPVWRRVAAPSERLRVVSLTSDTFKEVDWKRAGEVPGEFFAVQNPLGTALPRLRMTPAAIVLDDRGVIERILYGLEEAGSEALLREAIGPAPAS